jgi:hypothetical protein
VYIYWIGQIGLKPLELHILEQQLWHIAIPVWFSDLFCDFCLILIRQIVLVFIILQDILLLTGIHQFFYGLVVFIFINAFEIYIWAHLAIWEWLSFISSKKIEVTEFMSLGSEMILILLVWHWTYLVQQCLAPIEARLVMFEKEAALVILLQGARHMAFAWLEHFQMTLLIILLYEIHLVLLVEDFVKVGKAWF